MVAFRSSRILTILCVAPVFHAAATAAASKPVSLENGRKPPGRQFLQSETFNWRTAASTALASAGLQFGTIAVTDAVVQLAILRQAAPRYRRFTSLGLS